MHYSTKVTYGLGCSPYLAIRTLRELARAYRKVYPLAVSIVEKESYMDDKASDSHSLKETIKKKSQLIRLLKESGFELRERLSNYPEVLADLPKEHLAADTESVFENSSSVTVLRLACQAKDDIFRFDIDCEFPGVPIMRSNWSKISKIFDPMVIISTISAKDPPKDTGTVDVGHGSR